MSSAKDKEFFGNVLTIAGSLATGFTSFLLLASGFAISYAGARQARLEAERRARAARENLGLGEEQNQIRGNVRGSLEHHALVFGMSRVGGVVVNQGPNTPTPNDFNNQDFYLAIANSISHPGGCEGMRDFWIDDNYLPLSSLDADPAVEPARVGSDNTAPLAITYGNRLVSVGIVPLVFPQPIVLLSEQGINWREVRVPINFTGLTDFRGVSYGNDTYVAVGDAGAVLTSPDGETWTQRTAAASNDWTAVAWSEDLSLFVAVSETGTGNRVMTSPDGITWTSRTSAADNAWRAVVWAPDISLFAAVSNTGTGNRVMTSPDGITWTIRTSAGDKSWQSIAWSGGIFAAVADGAGDGTGRVQTSTDGITWTLRTVTNVLWRSVAWSDERGRFVAVSSSTPTNKAMYSADGITWTDVNTLLDSQWFALTWTGKYFVAVASSGDDKAMTSPNGEVWTKRTIFPSNYTNSASNGVEVRMHRGTSTQAASRGMVRRGLDLETDYRRGVAWSYARFRRPVSDADFSEAYRFSLPNFSAEIKGIRCYDPRLDSTNGGTDEYSQTWTDRTAPASTWNQATHSKELGLWCAVGNTGAVMTSPDGITWTSRTAAEANNWNGVAWSPSQHLFAAVAGSGTNRVMTSPDGITWTARSAPSVSWKSVTWSPERSLFVAVGAAANGAMTSPDGITWTQRTTTSNSWQSVVWAGDLGLFVAVDNETGSSASTVMTSPDGITWTDRTAFARSWRSITWSPELQLLCAVAESGTGTRVMTSSDGINWTLRTAAEDAGWSSVVWGWRQFIAVAETGTNRVMTSPDGITWSSRTITSSRWNVVSTRRSDGLTIALAIADSVRGASSQARDPMRLADEHTWEWTDNPILHAATYSIMEKSDAGWGIPTDQIDWESVTSAANICEEPKDTPNGSRNRFVGNGVLSTADTLEVNLQKILDACAGRRIRDLGSGRFKFFAGAYRAPTFVITESWLAGPVNTSTRDPLESLYNAVRVNYNDRDLDYQTIEAPPFTNASYEVEDGGERVWRDLTLPMVSNTYDAQYLGQIIGKRSRFQTTLEVTCNLRAMDVEVWETCTVELDELDLAGRVFRVEGWEFAEAGIKLTLKEDHPDIYEVDEMTAPV